MNVVNYEKLKEILRELWNRIKDQFIKSASLDGNTLKIEKENGSTIDVNLKPILKANNIDYDDANTNLGLDNVQDVLEFLEKDKASLSKNNVFVGTNTFSDVKLLGKNTFVETDGYWQTGFHPTDRYCGYRSVSTHSDGASTPKYVSAIRIDVNEGLDVGDTVGGVHIVEVEKKTSKLTDIVGDKITEGGSFIVEKDSRGQKVIYVPVEKEYTKDTYFLIGQAGLSQMAQSCYLNVPDDDSINRLMFNDLPATGQPLNHTYGINWVIRHALTNDTIDVREELKSLNNKITNAGSGTVTSVNGQTPNDQGEVTVGITNIQGLQDALDNKVNTSEVGNENNKIPRLNNGKLVDDIIPELAITRIVDATDQADALAKVNSRDIQVGDSVRLTGEENKVYQYTGKEPGVFTDRFIEISLGDATVRTVNGEKPRPNGEVTVHGNQISAYDGVSAKSVQAHLTDLRTTVNNHATRIGTLERKKPTIHVGEIITTFKDYGNTYKINGVTYLYCGTAQSIANTQYPQLMEALGLVGVARTEIPVIQDQVIRYDLGLREARRKHYIVAKID